MDVFLGIIVLVVLVVVLTALDKALPGKTVGAYRDYNAPKDSETISPPKKEKERVAVMAVLCEQCSKPYLPKVEHQKYCSAKCRTKANSKKV
jgi:hypothetical protein